MSSPGALGLAAMRLTRDLSPALAPASGVCFRFPAFGHQAEALAHRYQSVRLAETACL